MHLSWNKLVFVVSTDGVTGYCDWNGQLYKIRFIVFLATQSDQWNFRRDDWWVAPPFTRLHGIHTLNAEECLVYVVMGIVILYYHVQRVC